MCTKNYILILTLIYGLLAPFSVSATQLYFTPTSGQFGTTDQFEVILLINPEEEIINAIEGEILYDDNLLRLLDINDGNSVITIWVDKPELQAEGRIFFRGIVPGGFSGLLRPYERKKASGEILTVTFESLQKGSGSLEVQNSKVLIHDGLGTSANVVTSPFLFEVFGYVGSKRITKERDITPPEHFTIEISSNESIFEGKYFLTFNTQDKGSGIDYYKVKEGNNDFEITESPYLIKNQMLYDDIIIQALDKSGNIREEMFLATESKPPYRTIWFPILIVIVLLLWMYKKRKF